MTQLPDNFIEARRLLLRTHPFYGLPAMGSKIEMTDSIPTACTDGTSILISPKFIHRMPVPYLAAVLAHECIHIHRQDPDMMHRGEWADHSKIEDKGLLNQALDFWINNTLIDEEGFKFPELPGGGKICYNPNYRGWTVRQIYTHLLKQQKQQKGGGSDGTKPGQGTGGLAEGNDIIPRQLTPTEKTEQTISTQQAAEAAKGMGKLPGWASEFVRKQRSPKIQFRDLLEAWLHDTFSKEDISYRRLSRHYLPDWFIPTACGLTFGRLDIFMDTSGSCWDDAPKFLSLVNKALKQLRPVDCYLSMFDTQLQGTTLHFPAGTNLDIDKTKVHGCGGTSFLCIFDHLTQKRIQTDGVIILTDLEGTFPRTAPPFNTLWVSTSGPSQKAPFGRTFALSHGEQDLED